MLPRHSDALPRVAFWLVPEPHTRVILQDVIHRLAQRYAAPVFVPHVTLCSCARTPQGEELAALAHQAASLSPPTMQVTGPAAEGALTRALYLDLVPDEAAAALHARLRGQVSPGSSKAWRPHLSLLYQNLPRPMREALVRQQVTPVSTLRLTELWAVAIPAELTCLDNLVGWRTLLRCRLALAPGVDNI